MRVLLAAALAAGCAEYKAEDVEGTWVGSCAFDDDEVAVELDVSSAKWGIVEGDIRFEWEGDEWDGEVDGTHSGDVVELSIAVEFEGDVTWDGLFEGDLDGNELSGPMHLEGGPFELDGDCFLEED